MHITITITTPLRRQETKRAFTLCLVVVRALLFENFGSELGMKKEFETREYQTELVQKTKDAVRQGFKAPLVVSTTGSGKTYTSSLLIRGALQKNNKVMFVAPRRGLVFQTAKAFQGMGIRCGVIMSGESYTLHERVQVCSIDTLTTRYSDNYDYMPRTNVAFIDEAHLATTPERMKLLEYLRDSGVIVVGLTATPCLGNGKGLPFFDVLIQSWNMAQMIEAGYLAPLEYFAPSKPDLDAVKVKENEYNQVDAARVMNTPDLIGDIVDNWKRLGRNRRTIVSCVDVKHSIAVRDEFNSHGIRAEHIDHRTPDDEREDIIRRLESGEIQIITNVFILSYGIDIPSLEVVVIARPTKSIRLYMQLVGRVVRTCEGKEIATVIDHGGVLAELGKAEKITEWALDPDVTVNERQQERKEKEREPVEIECTVCKAIFEAQRQCPVCGHQMIQQGIPIPVHEAKLVEFSDGSDQEKDQKAWNKKTDKEVKEQFYGELMAYGIQKGYKPGWAMNQYRERSGVWPNAFRHVEPREPTDLVRNWVKNRAIAFHAMKKKQQQGNR